MRWMIAVLVLLAACQAPQQIKERHYCQPEERDLESYTKELRPVCGFFDSEQIQCFKEPCAATFGNPELACHDATVLFWEGGPCPT